MSRLALFDLDDTLVTGDSEVLWVDYLLGRGLLPAALAERNAAMARDYAAGSVTPHDFCAFYAATFGGARPAHWEPLLDDFAMRVIRPRIPAEARALLRCHADAGDTLVLTTAASRVLTQPTARLLGFGNVIATELEIDGQGVLTGRLDGTPNMREGKPARLRDWLAARGLDADAELARAAFYSDSSNDLPLLLQVGEPVAVDPDARLLHEALARRWRVLTFARDVLPLTT